MSESKGQANANESERGTPTGDLDDESGEEMNTEEQLDWDQYLTETKSEPADKECFWQSPVPPKNSFKVGNKLEAIDPKNSSITSVATVVAVYGPKLKIRLDGAGSSNDFWTLADSSRIHPFGFTEKNGGHLQPPWSYEKDPVRYQNSIINSAKESGYLAPDGCFTEEPPRPNSNLFKIGTKLEAIDARNPTWVCPATVMAIAHEKITIEYDGWGQQDLVRYDSRDLYPCGWWKQAGIRVAKPPAKKRPPSTGRRGRGRGRGRPSLKRPLRPHSVGPPLSASPQSTCSEPRNIFDTVLAKTLETPEPSPPVSTSKTTAQTSPASEPSVAGSAEKPPSDTSALGIQIKDATPPAVVKQHQARKTIAFRAESTPQERKTSAEPSTSAKPTNNGTANHKDILQSNGMAIPEPDVVIPLGLKQFSLHFNGQCNGGPYLDLEILAKQRQQYFKEFPMQLLVRDAFQMLVYCARPESTLQVFNAIPTADINATKGLTITCYEKDQSCLIRTIPMYSSAAVAKRALKEVLTNLKACPNLISAENTGCSICCDGPVTKKIKPNTGITIDLTRKGKQNDDGALEEPAAWWTGQDPSTWSVDEVVRFIGSVMSPEAAAMFKRQEIDGHAMVLLTPEILIKFMDVRVGPAMKISNAIERLKGTNRPNYVATQADIPDPSGGLRD